MTNHDYKAIAARLVERGIVGRTDTGYYIGTQFYGFNERIICHDWRVAGACMERMATTDILNHIGMTSEVTVKPLAIILAYLEAADGA